MSERMKILIGYDGSECADAALQDLRRAGLPSEADVLVMTVADVFLPPPIKKEDLFHSMCRPLSGELMNRRRKQLNKRMILHRKLRPARKPVSALGNPRGGLWGFTCVGIN